MLAAARRALRDDPEFMKSYKDAFENSFGASKTEVRVAKDLLSEGRISLATIIEGDTKTLGRFFENPENISSALMRATPKERQDFLDGRKLVADKVNPSSLTVAQQESVAFYKKAGRYFQGQRRCTPAVHVDRATRDRREGAHFQTGRTTSKTIVVATFQQRKSFDAGAQLYHRKI